MTQHTQREIARTGDFFVVEDLWMADGKWASAGYFVRGPLINDHRLNRYFPLEPDGHRSALACMHEEAAKRCGK